MSKSADIKEYLLDELGLDLVGIADAALLEGEPYGNRPSDVLPGAKSIIVFGKAISDGSIQTVFRHFEDGHPTARGSYTAYGADLAPNFTMFFNTFDLAKHIEKEYGCPTAPLPCGSMQCGTPVSLPIPAFDRSFSAELPLDIGKAAVLAGLACYGWSGRLLTKEYGPRVHFGAAVTQLELEYDEPFSGESLCLGESCQACASACPANAMPRMEDGEAEAAPVGEAYSIARLKLNRCITAACALRKEFGGEDDFCPEDPSDEELRLAFERKPLNNFEGLEHYPKWRCDRCLVYCRAGNWDKKFGERGLSKGT